MELTSAFTYLIFQHSLRIRFKSTNSEEEKKDDNGANAVVMPSPIEADSNVVSKDALDVGSESWSDSDTLVVGNAIHAEGSQVEKRATHLMGKINNLLTTDVTIISESLNFVAIRTLLDFSFVYDALTDDFYVTLKPLRAYT